MDLSTSLTYYKRPEIQKAVVAAAHDKEVAVSFGLKGFGKRPDMLKYPNDVMEFAKQRATSFHCSEELWTNIQQLKPGMKREELDNIRKGWDLVLDIDCKILDYSKMAGHLLPWTHRFVSNVKGVLRGPHRGVSAKHLQRYLSEACYRFNRRYWDHELFNRLLFACTVGVPITRDKLLAPGNGSVS